ncbi:hypothetical protein BCAR13_910018 [Paraburkholderia caribensis]|nr:hypothetical protein BCAR13_910018 [Paraburkholderia caribensis]
MLLGVPLVLAALRIAFLIRGATVLLGVTAPLTCVLANVAPGPALLRLLRRPGHSRRRRQKHRS